MSSYLEPLDIAEMCDHARPMGDGYIASCPLHDDMHESLKISVGKKATVLWCHAGCATKDILEALMVTPQSLFHDYEPDSNANTLELRSELRALKRELHPPPPMPNTLLGLMAECFSLPQPWHNAGLEAAADTIGAEDAPADAMRQRSMTKNTTVLEYFRPWCQAEGKSPEKMVQFSEWGTKKLQLYFRARYNELYT
jgi:hypothetical protein